jgi:Ca2+-dependent lipid-binding protein
MEHLVTFDYGGTTFKTKTDYKGAKSPVWNEDFKISLKSLQGTIKFTIKEEEIIAFDEVGYEILPLSLLYNQGRGIKDSFEIFFKGASAGNLYLET